MTREDVTAEELAELVQRVADSASAFISGDMTTYAELVPHGVVGGVGDQDWSLRATLVWRRTERGWEQVHRHADPLVHPISLEQVSALAAGSSG